MPTTHPPTGRRRRTLLTAPPPSAESVPQHPQQPQYPQHSQPPQRPQPPQQPPPPPQPQQPHLLDPPIYRALIRSWAERGKTLPGRHDPEWVRLAAPAVRLGQFSASRDPRGDGR
ncbi:hypothetical protein M4V62_34960 [Streptomyces durmitorensis]|uniref:DUF2934 domain-containing protein n=1 Tax=Streptomyces durmitorensis TaxID=319947 RepID=A0ABY4Q8A7_9ACTN|nr:hypothetical protein [Streptomyces durmitorensis]UQT61931.1 hypothetical protein M4V62_34960 [Streptomyces durmitorensis]